MLCALCRESDSLEQLLDGCRRAQRAVKERNPFILFDYYDGSLFRRKHARRMRDWNEESDIIVFLTMSTDGFEIFRERRKPRTTWPLLFLGLNLAHCYRSRATNALVSAFIPGAHSPDHFDSLILEIIADLRCLERQGICSITW